MIDLHTHTILSDGELLPSELVRRAVSAGYRAIALTDHADHSNIDIILPGIVKISKVLQKYWNIIVIPGIELTHVPLEVFSELTRYARRKGAKLIVGHGESPVEPVLKGTNRAAIKAGVDILAHPGMIREIDAELAEKKGVYLEITARRGHSKTNKHVLDMCLKTGAKAVFDTDTHAPADIISDKIRDKALRELTRDSKIVRQIVKNSEDLVSQKSKV